MRYPIRFGISGSLTLLVTVLFSLPVCSDDFIIYIQKWANNAPDVINIMDFPQELLPDGVDNLDFVIIENTAVMSELDDGSELAVIGSGRDTVCLGTVSFNMFINPAKMFASYNSEDSVIVVSSEYPGRAARNNASYVWDSSSASLSPVRTWESDRSMDLLSAADSLLEIGEIRPAADKISMMLYGWAYYDQSELCCRFLRAAHRASMDASEEEALDYYDAAVYAFGVIQYNDTWFISFNSLDDFLGSDYAQYIDAEELADILHDYAKLFRKNGFAADAIFDSSADMLEGKAEE